MHRTMHRTQDATTASASAGGRASRTLVLASLGFFLITLDILIVNVALTRIGREFGGSTSGLQWVIDAYTLMFAALLLFAGNLADRIGAKRAFGWGIAGFLVASVGCAAAPTLGVLIAARFVQGSAAAIMLPASMALIREAFPDPRKRTQALGIWAVGGAVAGAVGPVLGGALTTVDWRLVFAINLPVGAWMLVLLPSVTKSPLRPAPFDWAGQVAALVTLVGLVFGLIEGGSLGFGSPVVVASFVVGAAGLVTFLMVQARGRHPMMPLALFRSSGMRISLGVGFAFMVGNFGAVFVVSLFLQQHLGLSPLLAGLVFVPSAIFSVAGNAVSGTLANLFGARAPVVLGLFTMVVLASVPADRAGTASAVFNTFRQVGGAVAIAVFGVLISDRAHFVAGLQVSFAVAGVVIFAAAVASVSIRTIRSKQTLRKSGN